MKLSKIFNLILFALVISSCSDNDCDLTCPSGFTLDETNCECVDNNTSDNIIEKAGFISENETWTSDQIYKITGKVVVQDGVTLNIEAGTIIKGSEGTGSLASALIVARGGKLEACGTADAPIIMTSVLDNIEVGQTVGTNLDETQNGLWGGLIVLGYAPGSFEGDVVEFQIEGIPADDSFGLYGGSNINDNSGSMCYISIRHGGASIGENNEINGLTLGGVGNGTQINNIEVVGNLDDGIEFFGGSVNVTNALVWAQGDDAYDVDQAYSGTLDNFVYIAGADSDHGLEIDGPEGSVISNGFTFTNGSFKGLTAEMADFRDGAEGTVQNCMFFNFNDDGDLELDDDTSSANYFSDRLNITGCQFVSSKSVSDICNDKSMNGDDAAFDQKMEMNNSSVSSATVGANTNEFAWTYASQKGALDF